jgi:hypothetical protein
MVEMSARNFCEENSCPLCTAALAVQPVKLCVLNIVGLLFIVVVIRYVIPCNLGGHMIGITFLLLSP